MKIKYLLIALSKSDGCSIQKVPVKIHLLSHIRHDGRILFTDVNGLGEEVGCRQVFFPITEDIRTGISQAQYDKSLGDLREKMGFSE